MPSSAIPQIPPDRTNPRMPDNDVLQYERLENLGNISRLVSNSRGIHVDRILFKLSDIRRLLQMLDTGTIYDFPLRFNRTTPQPPSSVYRTETGLTFGITYLATDELKYTYLDVWQNVWRAATREQMPEPFVKQWDEYLQKRIAHKKGDNTSWAAIPMDEVLYHLHTRINENILEHNAKVFRHLNSLRASGEQLKEREMLKRLIRPVITRENVTWQDVLSVFQGDMSNTTYRGNIDARKEFFKTVPHKYRYRAIPKPGYLLDILENWFIAKYNRLLPKWRVSFEYMTSDNYNFNLKPEDVVFDYVRLAHVGQRHPHLFSGLTERNAYEDQTYRNNDGTYKVTQVMMRKIDIKKGQFPKCECCETRVPVNLFAWYNNGIFTDAAIPATSRKTIRELLQKYTKPHPAAPGQLKAPDLVGPPNALPPDLLDMVPFIQPYTSNDEVSHDLRHSNSIEQTIAILRRVQLPQPGVSATTTSEHLNYLRRHGFPSRYANGWMSNLATIQRGHNPRDMVGICSFCSNELWFNRPDRAVSNSPSAHILETNRRHTIRNYTFNPMDIYPGFRAAQNERKIVEITKKWSTTGKSFTEKEINRTPYFGIELEVTPGLQAFNLIDQNRYPKNGGNFDCGHIAQMIAAEITERYLQKMGLGVLKMDGSVHGGFELVTIPATHKWHTEEGWQGFFKEDYLDHQKHLAPSYYLSGWQNNGIRVRHPYFGSDFNTPTCGIHIHVSRDALSPMQFGKMQHFVNSPANKPFIELVAGRKENTYTAIIPKEVKAGARFVHHFRGTGFQHRRGDRNEYRSDDMGGRYSAINVNTQGKPTIEFRIFRSNVAKAGFMKNIDFVHSLLTWCSVASADPNKLTVPEYIKFIEQNRGQYKWMSAWLVDEQRMQRIHKINEKFTTLKEFAA